MTTIRRALLRAAVIGTTALLSAVGAVVGVSAASADARAAAVQPLPADPKPDYQLGGAYAPARGVNIVTRDHTEAAPKGVYGICYINGFQTQAGELSDWDSSLVLRNANGKKIEDPDWRGEYLLDTRTAAKRAKIAATVGAWIEDCADAGYKAVEFDNLDSFTRSKKLLTSGGAVALAKLFVEKAHAVGLAAGQKNTAELTKKLKANAGFDFAVAEECAQWDECDAYTDVYGKQVLDIEYTDEQDVSFASFCHQSDRPAGVVLRDRDLVAKGNEDYAAAWCS